MARVKLSDRAGVGLPVADATADTVGTATDGTALRRGSRELLRDLNGSLLIELVRESRPISRADLARQSGSAPPTVSDIVAQLLERGILVEVATAPANGGRPPVLLDSTRRRGYVSGSSCAATG